MLLKNWISNDVPGTELKVPSMKVEEEAVEGMTAWSDGAVWALLPGPLRRMPS